MLIKPQQIAASASVMRQPAYTSGVCQQSRMRSTIKRGSGIPTVSLHAVQHAPYTLQGSLRLLGAPA